MFIGHFALGFASKRLVPSVSLGTLFLAAQFVDLLWPILLLAEVERVSIVPGITRVTPLLFEHYPVSHSLMMTLVWGALIGAVHYSGRRSLRAALTLAVLVVSHWFLDWLVHRPDLPLWPGGDVRLGLGLWSSLPATLALELALLGAGVWMYLRTTRALGRAGTVSLAALVAFLLLVYIGNLFGEPPPSARAIAWVGNAQWLLVAWGYYVDRQRVVALSG